MFNTALLNTYKYCKYVQTATDCELFANYSPKIIVNIHLVAIAYAPVFSLGGDRLTYISQARARAIRTLTIAATIMIIVVIMCAGCRRLCIGIWSAIVRVMGARAVNVKGTTYHSLIVNYWVQNRPLLFLIDLPAYHNYRTDARPFSVFQTHQLYNLKE